jgi:general stress protein YciG
VSGTKVGGSKARETNRAKYGSDYYAQIGRIGGHNGHAGGFAANPELAKEAGRLGGLRSKRPKGVKRSRAAEQRDIELKIADFKEKIANTRMWEGYTPAEPLIKDEKIRKAVRAWADADGADEKIYLTIDENGSRFANKYGGYIEFAFQIDMDERLYTIVELCGEEEE